MLGEFFVLFLNLPLPGPVAGLIFLLIALMILGRFKSRKQQETMETLEQSSSSLLNHLSLLFVPAGVGVMVHFEMLSEVWLPLAIALVAGVLITLATTALCMKFMIRIMQIKLDPSSQKDQD